MYKKIIFLILLFVLGLSFYTLLPAQEKEEKENVSDKIVKQKEDLLNNQKIILEKLDEIKKELQKIKKRIK